MNKKIRLIVATTSILVVSLFYSQLTFAQERYWDYIKLSGYGTDLYEGDNTMGDTIFEFIVDVPPSGSEIPNSVEMVRYVSDENYTITFLIGDLVRVQHEGLIPINLTLTPVSEGHHIIYYEGPANQVRYNGAFMIPEFPPILIIPLFMAATLLALIYRRKRTSQNQTID